MISSFKLLLYIMKLNLTKTNSFVVSILVTSCKNRQYCFLILSFMTDHWLSLSKYSKNLFLSLYCWLYRELIKLLRERVQITASGHADADQSGAYFCSYFSS